MAKQHYAYDLDLWFTYDEDIRDRYLLARYFGLLNREERNQHKSFYFEKHSHQYLVARALMRAVLSLYTNVSPEELEFKKNKYGKPDICNSSLRVPVNFNISHTDKLIVLAVNTGQAVGVDAEFVPRSDKAMDIAYRYFSPIEIHQLNALPPGNRAERFIDLWTLKEAYIKACGMGLSIPLDRFSYKLSDQGEIVISFEREINDKNESWRFWQIKPNDFHTVAVALKTNGNNRSYSITMREIIPLYRVEKVDYPVIRKSFINYNDIVR